MSNTTQEWATKTNNFKRRADLDPSKNPQLTIVDGAQGGQDAPAWTNRNAATWTNVLNRLSAAGVSSNQVQVAWVKQARREPNNIGPFPVHAQALQADLEKIVRNLKSWFPNIQIAFVSSRTRSYQTNANSLNPEPFAYESGFATRWMIEKQIAGDPSLNYDTNRGPAVAPFLSWGPYLWANGLVPRSDGFTWACSDLENDFTHPNTNGVAKVADQLLAFFKTDPLAAPWFLRRPTNGVTATDVNASYGSNVLPFSAAFSHSASGGRRWWTYGDGTFSTNELPAKLFTAPGTYTARVTVNDGAGNWRTGSVDVVALTTLGLWRTNKFSAVELTNPNTSGDDADPDGDGINNRLEYVLGLEPKRADPRTARPAMYEENLYLTTTIQRYRYCSDFTLVPEVSTTLTNWSEMSEFGRIANDPFEILISYGGPVFLEPRQFVRYRVTMLVP